mmetsp:Transcript_90002/g.178916  ORF Transcript_90002/g.178916 Transcript_90002/m.178916 type:complete len:249 (+) Transcript_90002:176-922(+)
MSARPERPEPVLLPSRSERIHSIAALILQNRSCAPGLLGPNLSGWRDLAAWMNAHRSSRSVQFGVRPSSVYAAVRVHSSSLSGSKPTMSAPKCWPAMLPANAQQPAIAAETAPPQPTRIAVEDHAAEKPPAAPKKDSATLSAASRDLSSLWIKPREIFAHSCERPSIRKSTAEAAGPPNRDKPAPAAPNSEPRTTLETTWGPCVSMDTCSPRRLANASCSTSVDKVATPPKSVPCCKYVPVGLLVKAP